MRVKVEACYGSKFRLTIPVAGKDSAVSREFVSGIEWNRATARETLDMLESLYGVNRSAVRFVHV